MEVYLYEIENPTDRSTRYYLSLLPHEVGFQIGLPTEAVIGELVDGPDHFEHEHFVQNDVFVTFLHHVIAKHVYACPGLVAEGQRQRNGYVYLIDSRTPTPDGAVPPEDIIGVVEVEDGQLHSYRGSPKYQLFAQSGLISLDPWLEERLIDDLQALQQRTAPDST